MSFGSFNLMVNSQMFARSCPALFFYNNSLLPNVFYNNTRCKLFTIYIRILETPVSSN